MLGHRADDELMATEARFRALVAEWDLGRRDVARLLDIPADDLGLDLVPRAPTIEAEHRLRILVGIRTLLHILLPDPRDIPRWLRESAEELTDEEGAPAPCLLRYMSRSRAHLSAVRTALERRAGV